MNVRQATTARVRSRTSYARVGALRGLLAAASLGLVLPLTPASPALAEEIPSGTLDHTLQAAVLQAPGAFFDVLAVFEDRSSFAHLDRLDVPTHYYQHFPVARAVLSATEINALASQPGVLSVEANLPQPVHNAESRHLTGVEVVQGRERPADRRYEGDGVHVAVIDSGIDGTHPAFAGRIERAWLYGSPSPESHAAKLSGDPDQGVDRSPADGRVYVSSTRDGLDVHQTLVPQAPRQVGASPGMPVVTDFTGHGTHVAGTLAGGEGPDRGVAPRARLHSYSFGPAVGPAAAPVSFVLEAYDHILGDPRIRVVNASIGIPECTADGAGTLDWYRRANQTAMRTAALDHGVLTVNSYGNSGMHTDGSERVDKCTTLSLQPYILSVGATTKGNRVWAMSSRGRPDGNVDRKAAMQNLLGLLGLRPGERTGWDAETRPIALTRPGVMAPGARIISAMPPWQVGQVLSAGDDPSAFYAEMSGTSMAAPHVSGVAVLALEAHRRAFGTDLSALELIQLLEASADQTPMFGYAPYQAGAGLVDAARAVHLAEKRRGFPLGDISLVGGPVATRLLADGTLSGQAHPRSTASLGRGPVLHTVQVPAGTARLLVRVPAEQRSQLRVSLFRPGVDAAHPHSRPTADSGWNYAAVTNSLSAEAAFPAVGDWTVRIEAIGPPPGGNSTSVTYAGVSWAAEALAS